METDETLRPFLEYLAEISQNLWNQNSKILRSMERLEEDKKKNEQFQFQVMSLLSEILGCLRNGSTVVGEMPLNKRRLLSESSKTSNHANTSMDAIIIPNTRSSSLSLSPIAELEPCDVPASSSSSALQTSLMESFFAPGYKPPKEYVFTDMTVDIQVAVRGLIGTQGRYRINMIDAKRTSEAKIAYAFINQYLQTGEVISFFSKPEPMMGQNRQDFLKENESCIKHVDNNYETLSCFCTDIRF